MPTSNPPQRVLIIGAVVIIILAAVFFAVYKKGNNDVPGMMQKQNLSQVESRLMVGTVEEVSGQEITLRSVQRILSGNPIDKSARVVVIVTEATVIERSVKKDTVTMEKERAAFDREVQKQREQGMDIPSTIPVPSQTFSSEPVTLQDVKVGDVISVLTTDDTALGLTVTAEKITVQYNPSIQTEPPEIPAVQ